MNKSYFKLTFLLFIVFSFKSFGFPNKVNDIIPAIHFNSGFKNNELKNAGTIYISGTVKDQAGNALENIAVRFDTTSMALTDKDGKFQFQLQSILPTSHNIYFSANGFVTVVRTYYPAMGSANFEIILRRKFGNDKVETNVSTASQPNNANVEIPLTKKDSNQIAKKEAANISKEVAEDTDFPSIIFKPTVSALNGENKAFLDIIVAKLKDQPRVKINIKAYTFDQDRNPQVTQQRLSTIIKYLTAKGIAVDRLNKLIVPDGGDMNTIDFVSSKK